MAAATDIARLGVGVVADTKGLSTGLRKAEGDIKSFSAKSNRALARVQGGFGRMESGIKKVAKRMFSFQGLLAGVAGAGALGLLVKRSLDAGDAIAKTADAIGLSTDALQEYRHVAELGGVATATLDSGAGAFVKRLGELRAGTGALNTFLDKNNRALKSQLLAVGSSEAAMQIFLRAMGETANQADRVALSAAGFGRTAGIGMANLVKNGADEVERLRQEAQELGLVLEERLLRGAETAKDELFRLGRVISVNVTRAVLDNAPALAKMVKELTLGAIAAAKFFGVLERSAEEQLVRLGDEAERIRSSLSAFRRGGAAGVSEVAQKSMRLLEIGTRQLELERSISTAKVKQGTLINDQASATGGLVSRTEQLRNLTREIGGLLKDVPLPPITDETVIEDQVSNLGALGAELEKNRDAWDGYADLVSGGFDEAKRAGEDFKKSTKEVNNVGRDLGLTFESAFEAAIIGGNSFRDILQGIAQDILKIIVRRAITEPIAGAISKVDFGDLFAGGKALGGPVIGGRTMLVGEQGPELFNAPSSGTITSNNDLSSALRGGGGGGDVSVIVNNFSNENTRVRESRSGNNRRELIVEVGDAMASNVRQGGALNSAIADTFGLANTALPR